MPLSPLRLDLVLDDHTNKRSEVLFGLDSNVTVVVPAWVKEHFDAETWTGRALPLDKLTEAARKLSEHAIKADREDCIGYQAPHGATMEIDLTLLVLLLARDLHDLGESGHIELGGA